MDESELRMAAQEGGGRYRRFQLDDSDVEHLMAGLTMNRMEHQTKETDNRIVNTRIVNPIGQEQNVTPNHIRLCNQRRRFIQCKIRSAPLRRHEIRTQGWNQRRNRLGIFGQWRDDEGFPGIDNQRSISFGAMLQDIQDLVPRTRQACRRDVGCIHRTGKVQHQD